MENGKDKETKLSDITLINQGKKTEFDIYRKPTTTDRLIH